MASLFGAEHSKTDLLRRVGDMSQVAGIRMGELADGPGRGVRTADFRTGSGLAFTALLDRGLDILWADYRGTSLAWCSSTGPVAPYYHEREGLGWLRGFAGGLVVTCGFTHYGNPSVDNGEQLGLHGRAAYLQANHVSYGEGWQGDRYEMWLEGDVRQTVVFGENLVLRRRISARLGESVIRIHDVITNHGFKTMPLMLLYHCNLGYPILSETTELLISSEVTPRDPDAAAELADHKRFAAPKAGYKPVVFFHTPAPDKQGRANVALVNRALGDGLGVYMRFPLDTLPYMAEWKLLDEAHYVCGLEPATNWGHGRPAEREAGRLRTIEPGECRHFDLEIGVLESGAAIEAFAKSLA